MQKSLLVLGRQPELGLAELESLFGTDKVTLFGDNLAVLDVDPKDVPYSRLGGSVKLCKMLHEFKTTNWLEIDEHLKKVFPDHIKNIEGKLTFGISTINIQVSAKQQQKTGLELKKIAKKSGVSARVVPNKTKELNSASVLHNKLYKNNGWELLFVSDGESIMFGQTVGVQDIDAYAARDQQRPKRDSRVGMLPPKLAQIIINLATGELPEQKDDTESFDQKINEKVIKRSDALRILNKEVVATKSEIVETPKQTILDPFCGTGVLLQEALLMGYNTFGTDIEFEMIQYTHENLDWLQSRFRVKGTYDVTPGDATEFDWKSGFDFVASETYLGKAYSHAPRSDELHKNIQNVNTITKKFLSNLAKQTEKDTRICLALPAWKTKDGFLHLGVLDSLGEIGYNRMEFKSSGGKELIYHREGQQVGRELVVIIRK
ncbi:MAG: methyltransferase domain-containing protein [bacterium]|nr:methyltransferase domain-containing protein [bacterium]